MNTIESIETRRSIRKYRDEPVEHELLTKIVKSVQYAPSWKNTQIVRYNIIDNKTIIERIATQAVMGFTPNVNTISHARTIVVQTVVTGISGYDRDGSFTTAKRDGWQMYDAGISAQTFCLLAHEYGLGTVIMGIFDENKMREIFSIPENETVTAIIGVGYPAEERPVPKHKALDEILRFIS